MPERAFTDAAARPTEAALEAAFRDVYPRYRSLADRAAGFTQAWSFSKGAGSGGWLLKVADRRKALFYVVPYRGGFAVRLTLRDAEKAALLGDADLAAIHPDIRTAPRVGEGHLLQFDVFDVQDHRLLDLVIEKLVSLRR